MEGSGGTWLGAKKRGRRRLAASTDIIQDGRRTTPRSTTRTYLEAFDTQHADHYFFAKAVRTQKDTKRTLKGLKNELRSADKRTLKAHKKEIRSADNSKKDAKSILKQDPICRQGRRLRGEDVKTT